MDSVIVLDLLVLFVLVYVAGAVSIIPRSVEKKLSEYEKRLMKLIIHLEELVDFVQTKSEKISDTVSELEGMVKELSAVSMEAKKNMKRAGKVLENESKKLTSKVVEAINSEAARQLRLVQQALDTHMPKLYARIETTSRHAGRAAGLVNEALRKLEKLSREIRELKEQMQAS